MRPVRGFGLIGYLIAAGALLAALWGLVLWVDTHWETAAGVKKGTASKQAEWDEANRLAEHERARKRAEAEAIDKRRNVELERAQKEARDYEGKWRKERNAARNVALAGCKPATTGTAAGGGKPAGDGGVFFTERFVRLYDSAWTGQAGQPVFGDNAAAASAGADTLGAIGPQELTDTHAENAARCSNDRRNLNNLIDKINELRRKWDSG